MGVSPLPRWDVCETAFDRRFRRRSGASVLGSARFRGGEGGFRRVFLRSDARKGARVNARAGRSEMPDHAMLLSKLRLSLGQPPNLAVAHALEVAEHALRRHPLLRIRVPRPLVIGEK